MKGRCTLDRSVGNLKLALWQQNVGFGRNTILSDAILGRAVAGLPACFERSKGIAKTRVTSLKNSPDNPSTIGDWLDGGALTFA
jgi:hypothetical protein